MLGLGHIFGHWLKSYFWDLDLGKFDKMSKHSTIKIKPLSNGNYQEWSGEMRVLLMRSGLWSVVSGKATKPAKSTDPLNDDLATWETKQEKAAGEIYLGVESDKRVHVRGQMPMTSCSQSTRQMTRHSWMWQPEWRRLCPISKIFILQTSHWTNWMMNCCVWQ